MNQPRHVAALSATALLALIALAGCGTGSEGVTVQGDVPLAYTKRSTALSQNPTNGAPSAAGGDLILREKSSPSAAEHNVTAPFTLGEGDVSDPEASYDGQKIVFAMKCPASNPITVRTADALPDAPPVHACTGHWSIFEYDMSKGGMTGGTFTRITGPTDADDADPAYLPAGAGFVFTSNRQTTSKLKQAAAIDKPGEYFALDEYERERVMNLHTMDAQGGNIKQISVNQSHDRNPVVMADGRIMFSRWEHVGPRNRFAIFTVNPDGTQMFVYYGAQSPGNSFLHPREMDPNGPYKGFLASDLMPLSRTQEGGGLMFIDALNYSEQNTPARNTVAAQGGQRQATALALNTERGLSTYGRVTTPYPLWDGTNRVLIAYHPCQVTKDGTVTLCANLTPAELATVGDMTNASNADIAANPIKDNAPANYAIYMFDAAAQTLLPVAAPPPGSMYTDPIALQPRPEPSPRQPAAVDNDLKNANMGVLSVRSVYDTDGLGRMAEGMLAPADLPVGCSRGIAMTTPPADATETRAQVADLAKMRDPADPAYLCGPARFVRAIRAVAPPSNTMGVRSAIGETDFEQQQILGYAPIEPDGSFRIQVPADTPIALAVVDAKGRGIQTHLNWIQVRPGEVRTCDGCHSPRRGASLNSNEVANTMPAAVDPVIAAKHKAGETMAVTRTTVYKANGIDVDPALSLALQALGPDMVYTDVWADKTNAAAKVRPTIQLRYTGNTKADGTPDPANDLATAVPVKGLINYPTHIQPLWDRVRNLPGPNGAGAGTCVTCHTDPAKLDLRGTKAGTGRLTSYEELLLGDPVIDPVTGKPQTRLEEGVPMIVRGPALVETMSGGAVGMARSSRLAEIMFGETLKAGADALAAHPAPPGTAPDHSTLLNTAEKRLIAEWMDLGGQYFNDPFAGGAQPTALSQDRFVAEVKPILESTCSTQCHQAIGATAGASFRQNRFVLTGSDEGDFGVALSMISDTCTPTANYLLTKPSTIPHPQAAPNQVTAVLPVNGTAYNTIKAWIASGCAP